VYRVFRLPPTQASQADILWKDDLVSRQSVTARDAKSLGLPGQDRYVVVEGTDLALVRATELLKEVTRPLDGSEAERVFRRFRAQDEEAASGMGLIFGP
jgi:hypothetical protein